MAIKLKAPKFNRSRKGDSATQTNNRSASAGPQYFDEHNTTTTAEIKRSLVTFWVERKIHIIATSSALALLVLAGVGYLTWFSPRSGEEVEAASSFTGQRLVFTANAKETKDGKGYDGFRIPALATAKNGDLLAFAEGRVNRGNCDMGNIDLVMRRSWNNGTNWTGIQVLAGKNDNSRWGNPTVVVDKQTGDIFLFLLHSVDKSNGTICPDRGEQSMWLMKSSNNGATWSKPKNITSMVGMQNIGPGTGIQTHWKNKGRLVISASRGLIISDDHGKTWKTIPYGNGAKTGGKYHTETTVVERRDGSLYVNMRPLEGDYTRDSRGIHRWRFVGATDANQTRFGSFRMDKILPDPISEGSLVRFTYGTDRVMFMNSASSVTRANPTVRISYDGGKTWPVSRKIKMDPVTIRGEELTYGGYTSMTITENYSVAFLIERGARNSSGNGFGGNNNSIGFARFSLGWALGDKGESGFDKSANNTRVTK